jgi:ligand-binding sensor domain-containing protein
MTLKGRGGCYGFFTESCSLIARSCLFVAAACCILYSPPVFSTPVPVWAVFTQENSDLPSNYVLALTRGADSSVWVGTSSGLARIDKDGHWQTYSKTTTQGRLPDDRVEALAPGADGSLWVGTAGGLARLDKDGHWQTYSQASTHGRLPDDRVEALARGADGSLWVGTYGGLAQLDKDDHWQTYSKTTTQGRLPDDRVATLARGADGSLWVGTEGGLARLDKDRHWQTYSKASTKGGLPDDGVWSLAGGADGSIWVGMVSGLARLDKDGHWQTYSLPDRGQGVSAVINNDVRALAPGADGSLWVGTNGGLVRLDKDGHWQTYSQASTQGGLPHDVVVALAPGADGLLWLGTFGGGLARLDKDGYWQIYTEANTQSALPGDNVEALAPGADGAVWVSSGIFGRGLARLDKDGYWQIYTKANTQGALPDDRVLALTPGADGSLWVGTYGGLARLDKDGHWQTYSQANINGGLPYVLAPGADGSVWVGGVIGRSGLARLENDGAWQIYTKASTQGALPDDQVTALAPGADGSLWVGTYGGLARLDKGGHWKTYSQASTQDSLPGNYVEALAPGADGSLWVGTEGGLARLDKDGHWQTYSRASIRVLAPGADGSVWVGTGIAGDLARLDKDGYWYWKIYSKANTNGGLPSDNVKVLALGADGSLWVGTDSGLGNFHRPLGQTLRIVEVIGGKVDEVSKVVEPEQTVAVTAFDDTYLTQPGMFHYIWRLSEIGLLRTTPGPNILTRSSVYRAVFPRDGSYQLRVVAVDRYGNLSDPKDINFKVILPRPNSLLDTLVAAWRIVGAAVIGLLALSFIVLLWLAHHSERAFTILSDAAWARWLTWPFFFLRHAPAVQRWVLEPWFQAVRRSTMTDIPFLDPPVSMTAGSPSEGMALLQRLRDSPRLWLHGRSGMGKSSVFAAWERAYFVAADVPNLNAAVHRYGFILIASSLRHYAALPVPDANRPESWILEIVRRQLEQHGFATRDLGLVDAMLKAGHIAVALDGTNEVDRDLALAAFASQFPQARLLITSQAVPRNLAGDERWEVWELPEDISGLRDGLLALWLGAEKGAILSRRITAEGLSRTVASGYDLRLLADLAIVDPEKATLPSDRVALYRAMLARAKGPDGEPLRLEGLKQLAWTMMTQRRRRIVPDDQKMLEVGALQELEREGLRIVRSIGMEHEFRHDQMRAFLAALWLVEETPHLPALQKTATDAGAFGLNRRDQEELWGFTAPLLSSAADLEALWLFANNDPVERGILEHALQAEADNRGVTLVRVAQEREPEKTAA